MKKWPLIQPAVAKAVHEAGDQTLAGLARELGQSPFHAHRTLSKALGETPKEFTLRLRLDRAAGLLVTTADTILDIALLCGFESHEVFLRAFRRRFGLTPSAYRKRGVTGNAAAHAALVNEIGPCLGLLHLDARKVMNVNYDIEVKLLPAQPVLLVRRRVPRAEIAMTIGQVLRSVFLYSQANGIGISGHPLTRYPEYGVGMVTLETGMRVSSHAGEWRTGEGDGTVLQELLPAGPAASTIHSGPYDGLQDAYAALEQWITAAGRQAAGAPWEVYLNDPGDFPDPKDWKTELFWPLQDA
ncbi:MAG: helix-turn-helix domain-containing protein [Acidobacteria bacterium]|nr:helix-turn-helix domain-containing protein [Acidobacteriota bacterium]